jgi:hypothetical protein
MVTIVQDVISKGELTAEVQNQLEANLTADQKKFLEENATKVQQRPAGGKGSGNGQNPQGGANGNARPNGNAPQGGVGGQDPQGSPRPNWEWQRRPWCRRAWRRLRQYRTAAS